MERTGSTTQSRAGDMQHDAQNRMDSMGDGMRDRSQQVQHQAKHATEAAEGIPTNVYLGGVFGAIAASALLMLMGKKNLSIFVGLWPPTILNLAMVYKRLHPSEEFSRM